MVVRLYQDLDCGAAYYFMSVLLQLIEFVSSTFINILTSREIFAPYPCHIHFLVPFTSVTVILTLKPFMKVLHEALIGMNKPLNASRGS